MSEAGPQASRSDAIRLLTEAGPLVVFFLANWRAGIFWATGLFMAATAIALAVSYALERRVPVMPFVSGVFVLVFGALTLWLQDELFIKVKPTIVNLLFAGILAGGFLTGRYFLKMITGLSLEDIGWRKLTVRWIGFFILLAVLNEVIWRNFSTDFWVNFKLFGIMPLTFAFALSQIPLIKRHYVDEAKG